MQIKEELLDIEGIKASNKPLLDLFIRRTAVITQTSEALVDKIIKDQWRNANKMTQVGSSISEIDFSNLGTFYISSTKAIKRINRYKRANQIIDNSLVGGDDKAIVRGEVYKQRNNDMINHIKLKLKQL
jgi:hypothetical protein